MTLSRRRPASTTCSSLVNSFFLIFSGRVKNQDASLLVIDCCLASFRRRRDVEAFRRGSMTGTFRPRRSASELLRWLCIGSRTSLRAFDRELCANLNRSSVEKYYAKKEVQQVSQVGQLRRRETRGIVACSTGTLCPRAWTCIGNS
jgi:hypothetical protein